MNLRPLFIAAGAALALAAAPQARANSYDLTFNGVLAGGEDTLSLFGGNVQAGDPLSVTYTYDPSLGGVRSAVPGVYDELDTDFGFTPAAITRATITLDGFSYSYTPDYQASVSIGAANFDWTDGAYDIDGAAASGQSLAGDNSAVVFEILPDANFPTDLTVPTRFSGSGVGYFDTAFGPGELSDNFAFNASSVMLSAAPEPAAWSLMILAIGACGFTFRARARRRSMAALAV